MMKVTKTSKDAAAAQGPCQDRLDQLFGWLDGDLTRTETRSFERHLRTCDRCGALAEDLRRAIEACRLAGDCRMPATLQRRARARARALMRKA